MKTVKLIVVGLMRRMFIARTETMLGTVGAPSGDYSAQADFPVLLCNCSGLRHPGWTTEVSGRLHLKRCARLYRVA